jgi:hypothetical protein
VRQDRWREGEREQQEGPVAVSVPVRSEQNDTVCVPACAHLCLCFHRCDCTVALNVLRKHWYKEEADVHARTHTHTRTHKYARAPRTHKQTCLHACTHINTPACTHTYTHTGTHTHAHTHTHTNQSPWQRRAHLRWSYMRCS